MYITTKSVLDCQCLSGYCNGPSLVRISRISLCYHRHSCRIRHCFSFLKEFMESALTAIYTQPPHPPQDSEETSLHPSFPLWWARKIKYTDSLCIVKLLDLVTKKSPLGFGIPLVTLHMYVPLSVIDAF